MGWRRYIYHDWIQNLPTCWLIFMVKVGKNIPYMDPMTIFPFGGSSQIFFLDKGTATGILTRSAKDVDKGHTSKSVELLSWAIRGWNSCFTWHLYNIIYVYMGCFLKWWYPTTMGFPAKMIILIHFRVFWGYHRLRKHPYHIYIYLIFTYKVHWYDFWSRKALRFGPPKGQCPPAVGHVSPMDS